MDKKVLFSTLWVFVTVNYIFCDVFTLFHAPDLNQFLTGHAGGMELTQSCNGDDCLIKSFEIFFKSLV